LGEGPRGNEAIGQLHAEPGSNVAALGRPGNGQGTATQARFAPHKRRVRPTRHDCFMPTRRNPADEGRLLAARIQRQIGDDLRAARLAAGLSQDAAGTAAGISHAQFGRIERGSNRDLTFDQVARAGIAVGLRLGARLYPDGDPVRDRAQLALLDRFRARLPPAAIWTTEVPLPIPGDRRAWDACIALGDRRAGCEAETRLTDVQAVERRLALKMRDGGMDLLLLVVSDTATNRRMLGLHRESLRTLLPLDGRDVLASLRTGRLPERSGLVVI
jgi:transcriptional regulator with XRE-family HTH domain